ncbi:dehydrogenase/reductase SDR family member 11-like isoform X2 [Antedon mediterranea]
MKPHAPGVLHPIKCDVSKEDEITDMFSEIKEKFGGVDVCVNNAGILVESSALTSGKTEYWRYMLEINVMALAICTRESIYQMTERGIDDGHIFHINSLSGHRVFGSGFYAGTKHMVTAMTEGLRQELREKKSNIRVTSISPGIVRTEFAIRTHGDEEGNEIYNQMKNLEADDIANSLVHALHAPSYCQIHDILIRPIEQER